MLAPHQGMEMTSKRIDYFDPYCVFSAHFWVFETATAITFNCTMGWY